MSETLTGSTKVQLANKFTKDGDIGDAVQDVNISKAIAWTDGANANQAQVIWEDSGTLNATTAADIDLTALTSPLGTVALSVLKELYIELTTLDSGAVLQVGGDAASVPLFGAVADFLIVQAGGILLVTAPVDGYAVTGSTGDIVQLYNPGASAIAYKIVLKGEGTLT
jgi:hypothetical protein